MRNRPLPPLEETYACVQANKMILDILLVRLIQVDPHLAGMFEGLVEATPYPDAANVVSDPALSLRIRERALSMVEERVEFAKAATQSTDRKG